MSTITASATPSMPSLTQLRLTRRGRLVIFVAAQLVTFTALVLALMPSVVATDTSSDPLAVTEVTVQPGDTLWDVASVANPGGDMNATVQEIATLNSIRDGQVRVGQKLTVPAY